MTQSHGSSEEDGRVAEESVPAFVQIVSFVCRVFIYRLYNRWIKIVYGQSKNILLFIEGARDE